MLEYSLCTYVDLGIATFRKLGILPSYEKRIRITTTGGQVSGKTYNELGLDLRLSLIHI